MKCLVPYIKINLLGRAVVAHAFHSGGRGRWISEVQVSLVYRESSRTARATQRNPVLENKIQSNKPPKL